MNDETLFLSECQKKSPMQSIENINLENHNWLNLLKSQQQLLKLKKENEELLPTNQKQSIKEILKEKLKDKWLDTDRMVDILIDISENAVAQWPKWEILPDYRTKLQAIKYIMEITDIAPKKAPQVNINMMKIFYWDNN